MSGKIFSIDIRSNGIAGLIIKNSLKGNRIETHRYVPFDDLKDDPESPDSRFSDAVKKLVKDLDLAGCEYVISISPELISYRNLQVPFKDRKKIRQILPFELEPTLPYPIEEVIHDFQTVRQTDTTDILVSVVKTARLKTLLDVLKENNIEPRIVTPGGLSTALCLSRFSDEYKDFIFVDIDNSYCTIFVHIAGRVHIARSFAVKTADPMGKIKKLTGGIHQTLASVESLFMIDFEPSVIFISGDDTIDENDYKQAFAETFKAPIKQINIFDLVNLNIKLSIDTHLNHNQMNNALSLAVVEIIGINSINFYGERSIVRKYWEEYKNDFIKTGLIAAFVFVFAMFNVLFEAHFLQKSVNRLNRQIVSVFQATLTDVSKIVDPLQQMRVRIQQEQKKNLFAGEMEEEALNIDVLNEISTLIPKTLDVEFTRFVRGDRSLLISGNTNTFNAVDDIKINLGRAKTMKKITISSANLEKSSNRIQFKLKIEL